MKIGLTFFPVRPTFLVPITTRADVLGVESIWISEHLVFPVDISSQYPYDESVGAPLPGTPLYDPLTTIGYLAGQTQSIRFGTSIYVLPLRHPVVTAKLIATLDALSGGRIMLGVGAGWLREEFEAVDMPFERRGARMDECIDVLRRLWSEQTIAHSGEFYNFKELGFEPKPVQDPLPILIGGESPAALRRAAKRGDGWIGLRHTPESAARRLRELSEMRGGGRRLEITIEPEIELDRDAILRFSDAGVDRLIVNARLLASGQKTVDAALAGLEKLAETLDKARPSLRTS